MADKKSRKLPAADMLERLRETASHLGMDTDEANEFAHKGMKRAGYKISPAYSDPDDDDGDDEDEDDLMPSRSKRANASSDSSRRRKGDGIWD
jgi:hypothetical protein